MSKHKILGLPIYRLIALMGVGTILFTMAIGSGILGNVRPGLIHIGYGLGTLTIILAALIWSWDWFMRKST